MVKEVIFKNIAEYFKADVYRYSKYMLKENDEAEDVTQEVIIKLWRNFDEINLLTVKSWLMRTTHNLCIDMLRRRKTGKENKVSLDLVGESVLTTESPETAYYTETELGKKIEETISVLPETMKSIFILYEMQNYKYKEISKILDLPVNTIKVNLFRARKKLQQLLRKEYEEINT